MLTWIAAITTLFAILGAVIGAILLSGHAFSQLKITIAAGTLGYYVAIMLWFRTPMSKTIKEIIDL